MSKSSNIWGFIVNVTRNHIVGVAIDIFSLNEELNLELRSGSEILSSKEIILESDSSFVLQGPKCAFVFDISEISPSEIKNISVHAPDLGHDLEIMHANTLISGIAIEDGPSEIICCLVMRGIEHSDITIDVMAGNTLLGTIIAPLENVEHTTPFSYASFRASLNEILNTQVEIKDLQFYVVEYEHYLDKRSGSECDSPPSDQPQDKYISRSVDQVISTLNIAPDAPVLPVNISDETEVNISEELNITNEERHDDPLDRFTSFTMEAFELSVSWTDGFLEGVISWNKDEDQIPTVAIQEFGIQLWSGLARRIPHKKFMKEQNHRSYGGFRVELDQPTSWTEQRDIKILIKNNTNYNEVVYQFKAWEQYFGEVTSIVVNNSSLHINGWCVNKARPSQAVDLKLCVNGNLIDPTNIKYARPKQPYKGFDAPFSEFEIMLEADNILDSDIISVHAGFCSTPIPVKPQPTNIDVAHELADQQIPALPPAAEHTVVGSIDEITSNLIRGWARNSSDPYSIPILDCYIDGRLYATTSPTRFRADLAKKFDDHGFHEFIFEFNPTHASEYPGNVEIKARYGISSINHKFNKIPHRVAPSRVIRPTKRLFPYSYIPNGIARVDNLNSMSYIVINRNGEALLEKFFSTFVSRNATDIKYDIIVVDHNSVDGSVDVCERWKSLLNVKFFSRPGNFSFSASNNFAVRQTSSDIVVFINNDVSFVEPVSKVVLETLSYADVGCMGVRLLDDIPTGHNHEDAAIQHLGVHLRDADSRFIVSPFESRHSHVWSGNDETVIDVPVVTGAFLACRRSDFIEAGGFDESYFYGMEDVALCFKFKQQGLRTVCVNNVSAMHLRGFSRATMDKKFNQARVNNRVILEDKFGFWIRSQLNSDRFDRPSFWTSRAPRIAFAVTEATSDTLAGDYFTALELAGQLSAAFPCECIFLEYAQKNHYDLEGCDVLIAMRDDYDVRKIINRSPHLLTIAWVRNWFERFAEWPWATSFDLVWASSTKACEHIAKHIRKQVELIPIATNWYRFTAGKYRQDFSSDYCFTGSYWGLNREIVQMLRPEALPFKFAVFGAGWDQVAHLRPYHRGALPYKALPDVYASSRLVIDDANHVTKYWGGVNSRVYDALAAGCLVITNTEAGSNGTFGGKLPVYDSPQQLEDLIYEYLGDENKRRKKVDELSDYVKKHHTYQLRAKSVWQILKGSCRRLRVGIKIGAPNSTVLNAWGDYHFARSMKFAFEERGYFCRIDPIDEWYNTAGLGDDIVIVLRGLTSYRPRANQINIMWSISHFDKVSRYEMNSFDHVFIASEIACERTKSNIEVPCSTLLQCTDPELFCPGPIDENVASDVLFVGNSRGVYRPVVRAAVEAGINISIFGGGWEAFVPDYLIKGQLIPNHDLAKYYRSANVVLNDHWDNMRMDGFVSNRLFDVAACGIPVVSDRVDNIENLFGDMVFCYDDTSEVPRLIENVREVKSMSEEAKNDIFRHIRENHSFEKRVEEIIEVVEGIRKTKLSFVA